MSTEWLIVRHSPATGTTATCTKVEGTVVVRWTVKCFPNSISEGIRDAKAGAEKALQELEPSAGS